MRRAVVLVLGDVGRSPRIQYHALSFSRAKNMHVDLIGYSDSKPHVQLLEDPRIAIRHIKTLNWTGWTGIWFLIYAPLKVFYQIFQLFWLLLFGVDRPDVILVQNPPSIPTLFVATLVARMRCSKLLIDWHNFGYTLLGLKLGQRHPLVRISYWYERLLGRTAHGSLCVTRAMQQHLRQEWGIEASVLYDRPPSIFRQLTLAEKHDFYNKLQQDCLQSVLEDWHLPRTRSTSLFTEKRNKMVAMRADRPALVVSSTSYTEDEDFSVLLKAVELYDRDTQKSQENKALDGQLPNVIFLITGKGPLKEYYKQEIAKLDLRCCRVVQAWLAAEDYPKVLACADLGISLHLSSSGLDLPMKVVDMFGCTLPVCAIDFPCLHELVRDSENGRVFKDSLQLSEQLKELLTGFPNNTDTLARFRHNLSDFVKVRWDDCWPAAVLPLLSS
eukprot:g45752.t1